MHSGIVLVVEDDATVARLLMTLVSSWGFQATHASTLKEATDFVATVSKLDLVICDVRLRRESGAEVVAGIREIRPGTPALFTSGATTDLLCETGLLTPELLKATETGFIQKPFLPRQLKDAIEAMLNVTSTAPRKEVLYASATY